MTPQRRALALVTCLALVASSVGPYAAGSAAAPQVARAASPSDSDVAAAVADARAHLLDSRTGDHWASRTSMGPGGVGDRRYTVYYALTLERLDAHPDAKRRAVEWLLAERRPGGGYDDPVVNYGMRLLLRHVEGHDDALADVNAEIRRRNQTLVGGDPGLTDRFRLKLFYAAMSDEYATDELFPRGGHRRIPGLLRLTPAFDDGLDPNASAANPWAIDSLLSAGVVGSTLDGSAGNDTDRLADVLLARRLASGTWKTAFDSVFAAFALHEAGYDADDPEIARALEWVRDERLTDDGRLVAYQLPVWDTAWALQALHASGMDPDNESMRAAAAWLVDARTTHPAASPLDRDLQRPPVVFREHRGRGWGYRPYVYSDWDDTAAAVAALSPYGDEIVADHASFLFEVQNGDGSWSAFVSDFRPLSDRERQQVVAAAGPATYGGLFAQHGAPGVTGHALAALGSQGYSVDDNQSVRRGVAWLLDSRQPNGLWLGVWGDGYTYATSRALRGLAAVGVDVDRPEVQSAVDALVARQNADGGWGERSAYHVSDPGNGTAYRSAASTPTQTAWALQALLAAGVDHDHPAVQRAVAYLLDTQRDDGSWSADRVMYNLGPPRYTASVVTQASVLDALSAYADAAGIDTEPEGGEPFRPLESVPFLVGVAVASSALGAAAAVRRFG